jgi:nucleotidyltransferase/DNA polymerase involved in DNA repair
LSAVPILAHLDLDAFFAAVEELEDRLRSASRSSSAATRAGRGVVATANYVAPPRSASGRR